MKSTQKFTPGKCDHCTQTTNYLLRLDAGTAHIMIAMANAVRRLGRNRVHLQKEMEGRPDEFPTYQQMIREGYMTSRMEGNASRPRYHGLIASGDKPGEYLITKKGAAFLRGLPVMRSAIVSKVTGHNAGYWEPDGEATIKEILKEEPYWWGGFESISLPVESVVSKQSLGI